MAIKYAAEPDACEAPASFHNTCLIRPGDQPNGAGWSMDHAAPVYRDGIDWQTDTDRIGQVFVLDGSGRNDRITGRVTVTCPAGASDADLAEAAGYGPEHFGYSVTRYVDGTALVLLHND